MKDAAQALSASLGEEKLFALVNNAGILAANTDGIAAMTQTNVYGAKYMCDNFIPLLHPTEGRIVNVGSGMGIDFIVKGG